MCQKYVYAAISVVCCHGNEIRAYSYVKQDFKKSHLFKGAV